MFRVLFALAWFGPSLRLVQGALSPGQNGGGSPYLGHTMVDTKNYIDWRMRLGKHQGVSSSPVHTLPQALLPLLTRYKPIVENLPTHQGTLGKYPTEHPLISPRRSLATFHNLRGIPNSAQSLVQNNRYNLLTRLVQESFDHPPASRPGLSHPSMKTSASSEQIVHYALPETSTASPKFNPKEQSLSQSDGSNQQLFSGLPDKEPDTKQSHSQPLSGNIQNIHSQRSPNLENALQQKLRQAHQAILQQYQKELQSKATLAAAARAQGDVSSFGGVGNPALNGVPVGLGNSNNFLVPKSQTPTTEQPVFGGVSNDASAGVSVTLGGTAPNRNEGNFISINRHSPLSGGFLGNGQNSANTEPIFDGDSNPPPSQFLTASQGSAHSSSPSNAPLIQQALIEQESTQLWRRILQVIRSGKPIDPQLRDFLIELAQYSILQTNPELLKQLLTDSLQGTGSQTSPSGHLVDSAGGPISSAGIPIGSDGLSTGPAGLPSGSASFPIGPTGHPTGLANLQISSAGLSTGSASRPIRTTGQPTSSADFPPISADLSTDLVSLLAGSSVSPTGLTGLSTGFINYPAGSATRPTSSAHLPLDSLGLPSGSTQFSNYQPADSLLRRQQQLQLLQYQQQQNQNNFDSLLLPTPSALQPGNTSPFLADQPYIPANNDPQSAANRPYQDPTLSILGGPSNTGVSSFAVDSQAAAISPRPATVTYSNVQSCLKNTWCAFALATFVALGTTSALAIPFLAPAFAAAGRRKREADYFVLDQAGARTFVTNYMRYINGQPADLSPMEKYIFHAIDDPGVNEVKEMLAHVKSFIIGNKDKLLNITIHEIEQVQHKKIPDDIIETIHSRGQSMANMTDEEPPTKLPPASEEEKGPLTTLLPPSPDATLPTLVTSKGLSSSQEEPVTESVPSTPTPAPLLGNVNNTSSSKETLSLLPPTPLPVTTDPMAYRPARPSTGSLSVNTQSEQDAQVRLMLMNLLQERIRQSLQRNGQFQSLLQSPVNQGHHDRYSYDHNRRSGLTYTQPRLSEYSHHYLPGYNSRDTPLPIQRYIPQSRATPENLTVPGRRSPALQMHDDSPLRLGHYTRPSYTSQSYSDHQSYNSQAGNNDTNLDDSNLIVDSGIVLTPFSNTRTPSQFTLETVEFYRAVCTVVGEGSVPHNEIIQFIGEKCSLLQYAGIL